MEGFSQEALKARPPEMGEHKDAETGRYRLTGASVAAGCAVVKGGYKVIGVIEDGKLDLGMGGDTEVTPRKDD